MSFCFLNKSRAPLWFTRLRHRQGGRDVAAGPPKFQSFCTSIGLWKEMATKSMLERIVGALQLGDRRRASTLLSDFSSSDAFQYVLQYCANLPDPLFALEAWKLMEEKEISDRGKCYLLTVRALCKGGYLKVALDMVKFSGEKPGTYPLLEAYNCLLRYSIRMKSNYANECLDLMERHMVGKNHDTYAELLELAVLQKNLSAVHEIWKECVKYSSFSIVSLRKFIWAFTRLSDLDAAYATLQHMVGLASRENIIISKSDEGTLHAKRLDIPIPCNSVSSLSSCSMTDEVPVISQLECNKGLERIGDETTILRKPLSSLAMKVFRGSFNDVIHNCAITRNYTLAEQLMSQMQTLGVKPSSKTYSSFIRAALREKGVDYCMEMVNFMEKQNMRLSDSTLAVLSTSCSRNLELDLAEGFLNQISTYPTSFPFDLFLEACNTLDRPERAARMLAKMKELKICPEIRTYAAMFSLFGNVNMPYEHGEIVSQVDTVKRIKAIEMEMMKNGIQHDSWSMKNLLKALGSEGLIEQMLQYFQIASNLFRHQEDMTILCNTVLHPLVEAKKSDLAIEVFKRMQNNGIQADEFTYNILIDCCRLTQCFRSACALMARMIREGYNIEAITYTALIQILLESRHYDAALKLLYVARNEGIQLDLLFYNSVLQAACDQGRLDVVEFIAELMHQEKFQPDPSTCSYVFTTYVNLGFYSTALEALLVLSLRMISEEEHILEEARARFEHLVLAEEDTAELEIMNSSTDSIAYALLNLRWCAILGCTISWLPDTSSWAKRLSSDYGSWSDDDDDN